MINDNLPCNGLKKHGKRKVTFYIPICHLLAYERRPFEGQKAAYYKALIVKALQNKSLQVYY